MSGWKGRGSRHDRGYGSGWVRLRELILKRDRYLCQCPDCLGGKLRIREASEVDHILPKAKGGSDDPSNLRAVHPECHRRLTIRENGGTPKVAIGVDGWPVAAGHPWNR